MALEVLSPATAAPYWMNNAGYADNGVNSTTPMDIEEAGVDSATDDETKRQEDTRAAAKKELLSNTLENVIEQHRQTHSQDDYQKRELADLEEPKRTRDIDTVRAYQDELFERAKIENIIAVLETGSGKTLIAVLLLRHVCDQEIIRRAEGLPHKICFFLVNSQHLVAQQHKVLKENLNIELAAFHGSSKEDLWTAEAWKNHFETYRVVVCTAEILNQCLMHSYIKMKQIGLLIFDEAHHAKRDHPYARIIRDYYLAEEDLSSRPRIFGMTASPVDSKTNLQQASEALEILLHAKIVTTRNMSLQNHVAKPILQTWYYAALPNARCQTPFTQSLSMIRTAPKMKKVFDLCELIHRELGTWAANRVWHYYLSENGRDKLYAAVEQSVLYTNSLDENVKRQMLADVDMARCLVVKYGSPVSEPSPVDLSSKVLELITRLREHFAADDHRAIIFVEQRLAAMLLRDLFIELRLLDDLPNIRNIRPGILLGAAQDEVSEPAKQQQQNLDEFRRGKINCVFATSVAEEGIDIPACNLVVRFDLYRTLIGYVQSRGRARAKDSVFAELIAQGDLKQQDMIRYAHASDQAMKEFLANLPEDRILKGEKGLKQILSRDGTGKKFITSPEGAICNFGNAILILNRYADSFQYENAVICKASFELDIIGNQFKYRVILPKESKVPGAEGGTYPNKTLAKRSAAFETCALLRQHELIDGNLDPRNKRVRPAGANAKLAVKGKQEKYDMKIKPDFWSLKNGSLPHELFVTVFSLKPERSLARNHNNIAMLTKSPFPDLSHGFPVYLEGDIKTNVEIVHLKDSIRLDYDAVQLLTSFTLTSFSDVFNKLYEANDLQMSYWLAPVRSCDSTEISFLDLLDVHLLRTVAQNDRVKWEKGMSASTWVNKFVVDPWSGKYRYFTQSVATELDKDSPVKSDKVAARPRGMASVLSYSCNMFPNAKPIFLKNADPHQPVLRADVVPLRRNFLDKMTNSDQHEKSYAEICPEPLQISRIPADLAATILVLPAIIHRFDSYLIALEAFGKVGLEVSPVLALEAITKDSDNTDEHGAEQVHAQRGMGKNYERLEFIGDSLLKMTTSISLYIRYPKADELHFHTLRMAMLANINLFNVSNEPDLKLSQYIRSKAFSRRHFYPEGLVLLGGKGASHAGSLPFAHEPDKHDLGQKTIADVSEAIIGASLLTQSPGQEHEFDLGVRAVTQLVRSEDHKIDKWSDFAATYKPMDWEVELNDPIANDIAAKVAKITGYTFKHPRLLRSAFCHSSDQHSAVQNYERLEFLGDAVLDMVSIYWLFRKFDDRNPQWLTEHKMAMVSNKFLGFLAVTLGFDKFLRTSTVALASSVRRYSTEVRSKIGEKDVTTGVWQMERNLWDKPRIFGASTPKALSDLVESYIGAVFIDSGFDYNEAVKFFDRHILWFFADMSLYDGFANKHPATWLSRRLAKELHCHDYNVKENESQTSSGEIQVTCYVFIHRDIVAEHTAASGRYAKPEACKRALDKLDGLNRDEYREKFRCNCTSKQDM